MQIFDYDLPLEPKHALKPIIVISLMWILHLSLNYQDWSIMHPASLNGEYFRLLTGNFFHSNYNHLLLNSGGLLLIWLFHAEHYSWKHYFTVLLICCIGSSLAALTLAADASIIGLSGALHGLIIYGACRDLLKAQYRQIGSLMLIGVIAKVIAENTIGLGDSSAQLIGMRVAVEAHLFGTITGVVLGIGSLIISQKKNST